MVFGDFFLMISDSGLSLFVYRNTCDFVNIDFDLYCFTNFAYVK